MDLNTVVSSRNRIAIDMALKHLLWMISFFAMVIPTPASASESHYVWNDYRRPYDANIKVCHDEGVIIEVDLPADFVNSSDTHELSLSLTSKTYSMANKHEGATFKYSSPRVYLNDAFFSGVYNVPVKESPPTQAVDLEIKSKYLTAGKNRFKVTHGIKSCRTRCCSFLLNSISFKDAPQIEYAARIVSDPSPAQVFVNDEYKGTTPLKATFALSGMYKVELKKDGYLTYTASLQIPEDKKIEAKLAPETTPVAAEAEKQTQADGPGPLAPAAKEDLTPPVIQISSDRSLTRVLSSEQVITGRAVDESGVAIVYVSNIEAELDAEGHFRANVLLKPGLNEIRIEAVDIYRNRGTFVLPITRLAKMTKKRLALVIGNANYTFGGKLPNPINDAHDMAQTLENLDFEILKFQDASYREMKRAIDLFGDRLSDFQVGLFYYAGHGIQTRGVNYLVPVDAHLKSEPDVEYDCIDVGRLLAKMENAANETNIIILDACRENPFERSWRRSAGGKGLAFMNAPAGSLIAYATSPGNTAADGNGRNGLYTKALLANLTTPAKTVLEMFQQVRKMVIDESQGAQVPWESTSLTGNFFFNRGADN